MTSHPGLPYRPESFQDPSSYNRSKSSSKSYGSSGNKRRPFDGRHERPRPISTGRLTRTRSRSSSREPDGIAPTNNGGRNEYNMARAQPPPPPPPPPIVQVSSDEDPKSVTQAILDLREKREQRRERQNQLIQRQQMQKQHQQQQQNNSSEQAATRKLKQAETKITSLMEELEELKFFHEIEMEPSSLSPATERYMTLAEASPTSQQHQSMDPRRISSLDRTSLELECQELHRHVEILQQEKVVREHDLERLSSQRADENQKLAAMEGSLKQMKETLTQQLTSLHLGKAQLRDDYESQISALRRDHQETISRNQVLIEQLDHARESLQSLEEEHATHKKRSQQQKRMLSQEAEQKLQDVELQLAEHQLRMENLTETLADRDGTIRSLEKELAKTSMEVDKAESSRSAELEQQARDHREALEELQQRLDHKQSTIGEHVESLADRDRQLSQLETALREQANQVTSLESQLASIHDDHLEELEKTRRSHQETVQCKLEDWVKKSQEEKEVAEHILDDVRKQLTMAMDRHQIEMEQLEMKHKETVQTSVDETKESMVQQYQPQLDGLAKQLADLQQKYDDAMESNLKYQVQNETNSRNTARELERRDVLRTAELERLHDKLDIVTKESVEASKEKELLKTRLSKKEEEVAKLEEQVEETEARLQTELTNSRKQLTKYKSDLSKKDTELQDLQDSYEQQITSLEQSSRRHLDQATKTQLEKSEKELISEKFRHESIEAELRVEVAKLGGKLAASEATLRDKRAAMDELELRLSNLEEESQESVSAVRKLEMKLNAAETSLAQKESAVDELESQLAAFKKESSTSLQSMKSTLSRSETALEEKEQALENLESQLATLQKEKQEMVVDLEMRLSTAESECSETSNHHGAVITALRKELSAQEELIQALKKQQGQQLASQQAKEKELRHKLENEQVEVGKLKEEQRQTLADHSSTVEELRMKLASWEETVERLKKEQKQTLAEYLMTTEELRVKLTYREQTLERLKEAQSRNVAERTTTTEKLQRELESREATIENLMAEKSRSLAERASTVEELRKELQSREETIESLMLEQSTTLTEQAATIEELRQDLASREEAAEKLKEEQRATLLQQSTKVSELEEELASKEEAVKQLKRETEEHGASLAQRTTMVEELKKELVARDSCIKELMSEKEEGGNHHERQVVKLEGELKVQKALVQTLQKQSSMASELENTCTELKQELERAKSNHQRELEGLRKEQLNTSSSSEAAATEIRKMEFQMESTASEYKSKTSALETELVKKNSELKTLSTEMESLRASLQSAVDINISRANETAVLQRRLHDLEDEVDASKNGSPLRDLHKELREKDSVQTELVTQIDIVMKERSEAIDALEQMIHEVQIRQDELDELTHMLEKREEELEHAKLIATKALASAQEIKTRYKNKGYDMQAEYQSKVEELNASVDYLTSKNDKLRNQQSRLENELRDKNMEIVRLKDELRDQTFLPNNGFGPPSPDGFSTIRDPVTGFISVDKPTKPKKRGKMNEFMLLENGFSGPPSLMDQRSMSSGSSQEVINDSMSTKTAELGEATKWLHEAESKSDASSTNEIKSEPDVGRTKSRSLERDQLRKYVRKRYIKRQQQAAAGRTEL